jgi:hypothetical protein
VELRGDDRTLDILNITTATEADWSTEYSDLILAIKIVDTLDEAIAHINTYGSRIQKRLPLKMPKQPQFLWHKLMQQESSTIARLALPMVSAMGLVPKWASAPKKCHHVVLLD